METSSLSIRVALEESIPASRAIILTRYHTWAEVVRTEPKHNSRVQLGSNNVPQTGESPIATEIGIQDPQSLENTMTSLKRIREKQFGINTDGAENVESNWGSISQSEGGGGECTVDNKTTSYRGDMPERVLMQKPVTETPSEEAAKRTKNWMDTIVTKVGNHIGVSLGTGCKCGRAILERINSNVVPDVERLSQGERAPK